MRVRPSPSQPLSVWNFAMLTLGVMNTYWNSEECSWAELEEETRRLLALVYQFEGLGPEE